MRIYCGVWHTTIHNLGWITNTGALRNRCLSMLTALSGWGASLKIPSTALSPIRRMA